MSPCVCLRFLCPASSVTGPLLANVVSNKKIFMEIFRTFFLCSETSEVYEYALILSSWRLSVLGGWKTAQQSPEPFQTMYYAVGVIHSVLLQFYGLVFETIPGILFSQSSTLVLLFCVKLAMHITSSFLCEKMQNNDPPFWNISIFV